MLWERKEKVSLKLSDTKLQFYLKVSNIRCVELRCLFRRGGRLLPKVKTTVACLQRVPPTVNIILVAVTELCVFVLLLKISSTRPRQKCVRHPFPLLYFWFKVTM